MTFQKEDGWRRCTLTLDVLYAALDGARHGASASPAGADGTVRSDRGRHLRQRIRKALRHSGHAPDAAVDGRNVCVTPALSIIAQTLDEGIASVTGDFSIATSSGTSGIVCASGDHSLASSIGSRAAACATGIHSLATATGYRGQAHANGHCSHACTAGDYSAASVTGPHAAAVSLGYSGRARGAAGCVLLLVHRNQDDEVIHAAAAVVGQQGIEPDVYYRLDAEGCFVVAEEQ